MQKRPPISATSMEPYEKEYLLKTIEELTDIMSNECSLEGVSSSTPIEITHPSTILRCSIRYQLVNALYYPAVGANIMSRSSAFTHLGNLSLSPTSRTLRDPSGSPIGSYGLLQEVTVHRDDVRINLDFLVFEVPNFDILIGHPIEKLLTNVPKSGVLNIRIGEEDLSFLIV